MHLLFQSAKKSAVWTSKNLWCDVYQELRTCLIAPKIFRSSTSHGSAGWRQARQSALLASEARVGPWRPWRCGSVVEGKNRWSMFGPCFIELDDGKIYRKALYLMVKTMVSCRFSLNSIQWMFGLIPIEVSSKQFRPYLFGKPNSNGCHGIFHTETSILNHTNASTNDNTIAIRPCVGHDLAITQGQRQTEGFWREMQIEVAPYTCCASACDGFLGNSNFQAENR